MLLNLSALKDNPGGAIPFEVALDLMSLRLVDAVPRPNP